MTTHEVAHRHRLRAWGVHLLRIAVLAGILLVMHVQHTRIVAGHRARALTTLPWEQVQPFFPLGERLGDAERHGGREVLAGDGRVLGYVIETAPDSDPFLGFSGPTNLLLAFGPDDRILGLGVITSRDTRDHVQLIARDRAFFPSWAGRTWSEAAARTEIDGVAGATLTSLAMVQGLRARLGAEAGSLKFPDPLTLDDARPLFAQAARLEQDAAWPALWHVRDAQGTELGALLRTSPAADEIIGYQGPTDSRIGFNPAGQIVGIAVGPSFDNEPYVGYVRDEAGFLALFDQYTLSQLETLDPEQEQIEGVSGATMTSMAVVQGMIKAARDYAAAKQEQQHRQAQQSATRWRTTTTVLIVGLGLLMGLTSLRGRTWFRQGFRVALIIVLGFLNGDLLSVAMFVGWAHSGIPWENALGLVVLTTAALVLPITTKRNVYCAHLCPHGAVQQLLPRKWKHRRPLPHWLQRALRLLRPLLLAWVMLVALLHWPFSLVDIEPFDAYLWRAAAWPTMGVAIAGLAASLYLPMGYCRYGCPTGAVLEYVRRHARSDRLGWADLFSATCLAGGVLLLFVHGVPGDVLP